MSDDPGKDPTQERGFTLADDPNSKEEQGGPPPIDFSTFVLSLGASAMMHLGLVPDPTAAGGETPEKNLELARQTIDTLEMLETKTRGNLDADESKLIQSVLYQLRMEYVRAQEGGSTGSGRDDAQQSGSESPD
jgi:hypothetical protein